MWQQGARRVAAQFGKRLPSTRAATTAATVSAASGAVWFATKQQESKVACDVDPASVAGGAVVGALVGAAGCYKYMSGKVQEEKDRRANYWPRKIMMLFGAPGAGKGTQGPYITDELNLPQLSTGDMLREAVSQGTDVGKRAKSVMDSGGLVSDEIVIGIIADRIKAEDCNDGFILDGFPRTLEQSKALDALLAKKGEAVSLILAFDVDAAVLEERICGRWMHKSSGRSYHVKFAPPSSMKVDDKGKPIASTMKDDETGEPLYQRSDDTAEALEKRLGGYYKTTVPILDHYRPKGIVKKVDGGQAIKKVTEDVLASLKK